MRVKCHKLNGVQSAVFFWEEEYMMQDKFGNAKEAKKKKFVSVSEGEEFDIPDDSGHALLAVYKDNLRVVHYGDESPVKKMASSPKNMMLKDEKDK